MKRLLVLAVLASLPIAASAAPIKPPAWAYMVAPPGTDARLKDPTVYTRPGSTLKTTQATIQDPFNPPDWYPGEHAPLPKVVEFGRKPAVQACMRCHLPNGGGHPESAYIAGLPVDYIVQQMHAYKNGTRVGLGQGNAARSFNMVNIARDITDAEIAEAAAYYSRLRPIKWTRVVEADRVPVSYMPPGVVMRFTKDGGGMEPLGQRIVEVPENNLGASIRDSHTSFIAYVPVGSIAKGRELATSGGGGKTVQCTICHGQGLKGLGSVPGIAGRSPAYIGRQLIDIQHGVRKGPQTALMTAVVANLNETEVLNLAAYAASLDP